ncbi:MAG: hypothetical protein E7556_03520 [Ruminococcaceae bacterium]|nr:hypothetical protein [Oscillospiraceae bacterium]
MYKRIVFVVFLIVLTLSISSCKTIQNDTTDSANINGTKNTNNDIITLKSLKENSDVCVFISTNSFYEIKTKNNELFITVNMLPLEWQSDYFDDYITIIEQNETYIEPESMYILFLSETEDNNGYYLTFGETGIFSVKGHGIIKPVNANLKTDVKKQWNNDIEIFYEWFKENYPEPPQAPEDTFENTTTNPNTTTDVS